MPLLLEGPAPHGDGEPLLAALAQARSGRPAASRPRTLDIALLNNMPDAALKSTERQYVDLLTAAAPEDVTVRLHPFSLAEIERGPEARRHVAEGYGQAGDLFSARIDALIVTGAEPRAASLPQEPYWDSLCRVVDWAEHHTRSTIWSCLAAHAAVLHLDGIGRRPLADKCFGLFTCCKASDDPLLAGTSAGLRIPHSRWNGLNEMDLRSAGYRVLTRSLDAGVDAFAKEGRSLFLFFQGHPEYDPDTLFKEYRRDVQRFLLRERARMPNLPQHYFDAASERAFADFAGAAEGDPDPGRFAEFPKAFGLRAAEVRLWREAAVQLYRNWLALLVDARAAGQASPARQTASA